MFDDVLHKSSRKLGTKFHCFQLFLTENHQILVKMKGKTPFAFKVQVNLIITLSLGSIETDRVISEPCYNEVIYNRYITK